MSEEKIKDILKTRFTSYEVHETTPLEWDKLESRLEEKRFFKFAYNRFNIYYLGFIAVYGVITTCLTTLYVKEHFGNDKEIVNIQVREQDNDSTAIVNSEDELYNESNGLVANKNREAYKSVKIGIGVENEQAYSSFNPNQGLGNLIVDSLKLGILGDVPKSVIEKESATIVSKSNHEETQKAAPVTIMLKQDTIKKYDTVFVYKKKKFRF